MEPSTELQNGRTQEALVRLYIHSKRFLVKALSVFNEEPTHERILRPYISETYFCLGDLALFRSVCCPSSGRDDYFDKRGLLTSPESHSSPDVSERGIRCQEVGRRASVSRDYETDDFPELAEFNSGPILTECYGSRAVQVCELFGENGEGFVSYLNCVHNEFSGEIGDTDAFDVRRQTLEYFSKGLRVVGLEIDDFLGRYPLAQDVFYSHMNLSDPVLHSDICRSVQMRHAWGSQLLPIASQRDKIGGSDSTTPISLRSKIVLGIERPRMVGGGWSSWLSSISDITDLVNQVRTDRPMFEICSQGASPFVPNFGPTNSVSAGEPSSRINRLLKWEMLFPERYDLAYFW